MRLSGMLTQFDRQAILMLLIVLEYVRQGLIMARHIFQFFIALNPLLAILPDEDATTIGDLGHVSLQDCLATFLLDVGFKARALESL